MWIALNKQSYPKAMKAFAIKNEEKSGSAVVGGRFKASGVKSGVHDILLPIASTCYEKGEKVGLQIGISFNKIKSSVNYSGLFLEMKKLDGRPSEDQLAFGLSMQEEGYAWEVCYGWEHGVSVIKAYLDGSFVQKDAEHQKLKYNK